ncbi:MAG: VanZ family protein [Solobacterium sp.]|nr:VanZ family protein [Solobacterium sp.]
MKEALPVLLFCVYMACVFHITLMPFVSGMKLAFADDGYNFNLNLVPYIDVIRQKGNYSRQVILNILLFVPFGLLYPLIRKTTLLKTVLYGFCLSLSIEILQFFFTVRIADVTDLINNTAGAFIGAVSYSVLYRILCLFRDGADRG